jgi:hypothetical protein
VDRYVFPVRHLRRAPPAENTRKRFQTEYGVEGNSTENPLRTLNNWSISFHTEKLTYNIIMSVYVCVRERISHANELSANSRIKKKYGTYAIDESSRHILNPLSPKLNHSVKTHTVRPYYKRNQHIVRQLRILINKAQCLFDSSAVSN